MSIVIVLILIMLAGGCFVYVIAKKRENPKNIDIVYNNQSTNNSVVQQAPSDSVKKTITPIKVALGCFLLGLSSLGLTFLGAYILSIVSPTRPISQPQNQQARQPQLTETITNSEWYKMSYQRFDYGYHNEYHIPSDEERNTRIYQFVIAIPREYLTKKKLSLLCEKLRFDTARSGENGVVAEVRIFSDASEASSCAFRGASYWATMPDRAIPTYIGLFRRYTRNLGIEYDVNPNGWESRSRQTGISIKDEGDSGINRYSL